MMRKLLFENLKTFAPFVALEIDSQRYTYKNLLDLTKRFEKYNLSSKRVLIFSGDDEVFSYSAILATIIYGGTFIPINQNQPKERILHIIQNIKPDIIFVSIRYKVLWRDMNIEVSSFYEDRLEFSNQPAVAKKEADILYILHTSGSTGTPKSVPISQHNVYSWFQNIENLWNLKQGSRLSQSFSLTFDLSLFAIFYGFIKGLCICVFSKKDLLFPLKALKEKYINISFFTPSIINAARKEYENDPSFNYENLCLSLFCGEKFMYSDVLFWQKVLPSTCIENLYGPTETTIFCTRYVCNVFQDESKVKHGILSIGKGIGSMKCFIKDEELILAGDQVFAGYLNAEKPVMNNLYPTGDSCIQDEEGDFYFVKRLDNEIKFHGYRINLSEIEHMIKNHTDILSCAVFLNNEKIVACYVTYYNKFVTESLLKNYLLKSIPSYSVPQEFYNMEELPLNQHGKIDYKRLKEMILESVITKKASSI